MKKLGSALMALGAFVGVGAGAWIIFGRPAVGLPWLLSIGLVKLTLLASTGIVGAGAGLVRLAKRADHRNQLAARPSADRTASGESAARGKPGIQARAADCFLRGNCGKASNARPGETTMKARDIMTSEKRSRDRHTFTRSACPDPKWACRMQGRCDFTAQRSVWPKSRRFRRE